MNVPEDDLKKTVESKPTSTRLASSLLLLLLLATPAVYGSYRLFAPFLPAMTWALAFAVLAHPFHQRLTARVKNVNLSAAISVVLVASALIGLTAMVSERLARQAVQAAHMWDAGEIHRRLPFLDGLNLQGGVNEIFARLPDLIRSSAGALSQLPTSMFCLFFFLRDGEKSLEYLRSWLPLSAPEIEELGRRVNDILSATLFGKIAIAGIQGFLGLLMFLWLGLPAPILWALIMSVFALVPFVGTPIVWVPAACYFYLQGEIGKAIFMGLWGLLVVSSIDNVLYPFLVGARMQLHPLVTFIGVVGGLGWFGACGLILGPLILATTAGLLEVCRKRVSAFVEASE